MLHFYSESHANIGVYPKGFFVHDKAACMLSFCALREIEWRWWLADDYEENVAKCGGEKRSR